MAVNSSAVAVANAAQIRNRIEEWIRPCQGAASRHQVAGVEVAGRQLLGGVGVIPANVEVAHRCKGHSDSDGKTSGCQLPAGGNWPIKSHCGDHGDEYHRAPTINLQQPFPWCFGGGG